MLLGTIINAFAIILGGTIGIVLNNRLPEKIKLVIFQALGLATLVIGTQMALKTQNLLILTFSLLIGGAIGEAIHLDEIVDKTTNKLKTLSGSKDNRFSQGLTSSFILFCIGSMAIIGPITEGLTGDRSILLTKSILDGFTAIALGATFGIGVIFSIIPLIIYQGGLAILASTFQSFFTPLMISELTAVGGALIITIGLSLMEIKKIKTINFLPALLIAIILAMIVK